MNESNTYNSLYLIQNTLFVFVFHCWGIFNRHFYLPLYIICIYIYHICIMFEIFIDCADCFPQQRKTNMNVVEALAYLFIFFDGYICARNGILQLFYISFTPARSQCCIVMHCMFQCLCSGFKRCCHIYWVDPECSWTTPLEFITMIKQERWETWFLKTPSWQSESEWFVPVLFRGGWNTLPAASHPLLKVLVLLKIYTWSFHGKIITGTYGLGWRGAPAKTSSTFVGYFQVPGVVLSLHVRLVKFLRRPPRPRERCVARSIGSSATWQNCSAVISVQELPAFGHRIARWWGLNDHFLVGRQFCIPQSKPWTLILRSKTPGRICSVIQVCCLLFCFELTRPIAPRRRERGSRNPPVLECWTWNAG